jgi:arylsulfatase A-like enzyme
MSSTKLPQPISRREFLKIASLLPLGLSIPPSSFKRTTARQDAAQKNILIVVYDALSAHNVSLYGYPRQTMPNLERLAERAVVYHNHLAGGNFTTPGTASMLTGVYPWTHRAFTLNETVADRFLSQNLFHAFPDHHRLAYTHNPFAQKLLAHLRDDIDDLIEPERLFFYANRFLSAFFRADDDAAYLSWARAFEQSQENRTYSLFLAPFLNLALGKYQRAKFSEYEPQFPRGIPFARGNYFLLEHATDYLSALLENSPRPFLGYFHFLPPHTPYSTRRDFFRRFKDDGYQPPDKPRHLLSENEPQERINSLRLQYDEYLLYVDHEFGRLYNFLERSGLLENTWLIFTSDHGEMFERATLQHTTLTMYQPVIQVPLIVFEPGRENRSDIYLPTSGVDLLPTLLHLSGVQVPDWVEGVVLPPFASQDSLNGRDLYSMQIKKNRKFAPLEHGSLVLVRDFNKLVYYFGYPELQQSGGEMIELYDLQNDPQELRDLSGERKTLASDLLERLKLKLQAVNEL